MKVKVKAKVKKDLFIGFIASKHLNKENVSLYRKCRCSHKAVRYIVYNDAKSFKCPNTKKVHISYLCKHNLINRFEAFGPEDCIRRMGRWF